MPWLGLLPADPAPADWFGVGLVLAIAGGFLLANSILFRHPRTLVEEHFGARSQRLSSIREYIFHRVQVHLGFVALLAGFGLQVYGRYHPLDPADGPPVFPFAWVGGILLGIVALELGGWWLSHALFRRYVREHFLANPPNLETDMRLARELGELFSIPSSGDDTVQSYLAQIRARIGLAPPPRGARNGRTVEAPSRELAEHEPEERLV